MKPALTSLNKSNAVLSQVWQTSFLAHSLRFVDLFTQVEAVYSTYTNYSYTIGLGAG